MAARFTYYFEWDPVKASQNRRNHRVDFESAATVFHDPLSLSRFDDEHSETEERWATIGRASNATLLVVVRIISARAATKHEQRDYEGKP